jgi:hypothetical protein
VLRVRTQSWLMRVAAVVGLSSLLGGSGVALATSAAAEQTASTHLVPGLLPGLAHATSLGTASADRTLQIGVGVQRPNSAAEIKLYDEVYDPKSSRVPPLSERRAVP